MATHQRVSRIRAESGVPPQPQAQAQAQPTQLQPEPEEIRNARLNELQLESLGSSRRDRISREDFPENEGRLVSWKRLDAARLSNKPGTKENEEFLANEASLLKWNNAWEELEGDGTVEEQFDDIHRGQAHRAKLMSDLETRREYGEEDANVSLRRHHADNGGRSQGGGRGGRGGGFVGSRSRVSGPKRVPVGMPTAIQRPNITAQVSSSPRGAGGSSSARGAPSPTRGGSPSGGSSRPVHGEDVPSHGPSSSSPSREPSSRGPSSSSSLSRNPASPGRPSRPPRGSGWQVKLAEPADFVTAFMGSLILPSTAAAVAKGTTAPADTPSTSLATSLTPIEAVAEDTHSSSPAPHPTIENAATAGAATPSSVEEKDNESALIDFGDGFDSVQDISAFSQHRGDEAKGLQAITPSAQSEQSYASDLVGLDIQPDAGQALHVQGDRTDFLGGRGSIPSIADIHTQLSSFTPLLKDVVKPELIESFENLITELQLKSMDAARTSEAASDVEPPTEAFGRLSIHDHDPIPTPVGVEGPTAAPSRYRSTFRAAPEDLAADHHPRVRLPPREVYGVDTADNVQQGSSPDPEYGISRPQVGKDVHEQVSSIAVGASISPPGPETKMATKTAEQEKSFDSPAKTHEPVRSNFPQAREQVVTAVEKEAKDSPGVESILTTTYPSTRGTTINRVGYLKAPALPSKKENTSSAGKYSSDQAEASGSKPRAVSREDHLGLGGVAGNVIAADPQNTSKMTPTAKTFVPPHARTKGIDVAAAAAAAATATATATATPVPANPSSVEIPAAVKSQGQLKSDEPKAGPSLVVEADKKDEGEEEEENYPLEAILKGTIFPSGPSMLNRTGFYRR